MEPPSRTEDSMEERFLPGRKIPGPALQTLLLMSWLRLMF